MVRLWEVVGRRHCLPNRTTGHPAGHLFPACFDKSAGSERPPSRPNSLPTRSQPATRTKITSMAGIRRLVNRVYYEETVSGHSGTGPTRHPPETRQRSKMKAAPTCNSVRHLRSGRKQFSIKQSAGLWYVRKKRRLPLESQFLVFCTFCSGSYHTRCIGQFFAG